MTRDFASTRTFPKREKADSERQRQKPALPDRTSRRLVGLVLVGTIGASLFLWQKEQLKAWWQTVWGPAEYEIINPEIVDTQLIRLTENLHQPSDVVASIKELTAPLQGTYGAYVIPLEDGEPYGTNENQVFTAASVNKVLIMVRVLQAIDEATLRLTETYRLQAKDIQDYGTGSLRYAALGTSYTIDELLALSGKQSDNTAAWVLNLMVGEDKVQELVNDLGMEQTSIAENTTTPKEMGEFFRQVYRGKVLPANLQEKFYGYLTRSDFEDRIPAGLPSYVTVAHKIGTEIQTVNDCGIVFTKKHPYVVCLLSKEAKEAEAQDVLPKISHLIWVFESSKRS
jgi:beta-lactamase class A